MSRYIDADRLVEHLMLNQLGELGRDSKYGQFMTESGIIRSIQSFPTADVQEAKHGKWEDTGDGYLHRECGMFFDTYLWANCYYNIFQNGFNYCPKCGAKMDGERRDDGET